MVNERRWLQLIFILYFLFGVGYSLLMPIWEAPDEPAHYHLAWRLARKGSFPAIESNYEANQPRTFYVVGSYVIHALDSLDTRFSDYVVPGEFKQNIRVRERRFDWSDGNYRFLLGVYTLRWINLLFGGLALWLNWKTFKILAPEKPTLQLSALALAALTPQYLHIMSSVNNDALGTLAGALLFYLTIHATAWKNNLLDLFVVMLAIALPLTTKLTVLPVSAAALMFVVWKWFTAFRQKRWLIIFGISILLIATLLSFVFPNLFPSATSEITWRLFTFRDNAWTWKYIKFIGNQIMATYWGQVGWLAVGLPMWVIYSLTTLGFTGIALWGYKLFKSKNVHPQFNLWLATILIAALAVLAVARNGLTTRGTQGRLLFPAIGAVSLLMIAGWHNALPARIQRNLPLLVTILMIGLNIWLWVSGVIPVYYQPFLD